MLVTNGRATGVVLENGDYFLGSAVLSSVDARRTFLKMVEPEHLPAEFIEDIRRFKFRGSSGKVNLALDAPARVRVPARRRSAPARRDLDLA